MKRFRSLDFSNWRNYLIPRPAIEREDYPNDLSYAVTFSLTWLYRRVTIEWHGYKP